MLQLYDYYRSTASYRVRITLHIKNLAYDNIPIDLVKDGGQHHNAEYRKHNPQGMVPCLVDRKNELTLSQSLAIIDYIEECYPTPSILPDSLTARAQARQIAQLIACDIHPLNNLRVLQYLTKTLGQSEDIKTQWYHHWLQCGFEAIEALLKHQPKEHPFCVGHTVSIADICLLPQLYNARRFAFPLESYSNILRVEKQCLALPSFQQAHPDSQKKQTI